MEPIELESSPGLPLVADDRRRMDEPPPVRLVSIDDVRLPTPPGKADKLDDFYGRLLRFDVERSGSVYRAENFRLRFQIVAETKPIERDGVRPQGIEVPSLPDTERLLIDAEIDYIRERGLVPGQISLLVRDPAGNWVELFDSKPVG